MSAWNPADGGTLDTLKVTCSGNIIDVSGLEGSALCNKLCAIAREYDIGKFDVFDGNGVEIEEEDLEDGSFEGNLRIEKHNESN